MSAATENHYKVHLKAKSKEGLDRTTKTTQKTDFRNSRQGNWSSIKKASCSIQLEAK